MWSILFNLYVNDSRMDKFVSENTIIEGLSIKSVVNQKEIFGPVVTISSFKNESDVINSPIEAKQ